MQNNKIDFLTISLAGLVQAISLAREVAQTGKTNETAFKASIESLFHTNPEHVIAVYGDLNHLKMGLDKLIQLLNFKTDQTRITIRYMLSIMRIQKKIFRSPDLIGSLKQRIEQSKKQVDYFFSTHPTVIANLADIYAQATGPFRYRFFMLGNKQILEVQENMEKIKALLLAAIRASLLWRQSGGSRLKLIFLRHQIKTTAIRLMHLEAKV